MKRTSRLTLPALAALLLASCQGPTTPPTPDTTTVAEVLAAEGFTTLAAAVTTAGLGDTLAGAGPFTIFAPTNEAFEALPDGALAALLADTALLADVLSYHVLPEEANAAALTAGFRTTVQESPVAVTLEGDPGAVTLNGVATVTEPDIEADNGVVHGINSVLEIPQTVFSATLAGANEVPPVESSATGEIRVSLAATTLTIVGSYEGLTVINDPGAHIHGPADTTQNADVLFPLTFDNAAGTLSATVDLAAPENAAFGPATFGYLQNELLYANLHTEENPTGEIRGQIFPSDDPLPAPEPDFTAILRGSEEVPPVSTSATGTASASLDEANTTLTVTGTYTGLSGPAQAGHIHEAPRGENGDVIVPLTLTPDADDSTAGTFEVTATIGTEAGQLSLETLQNDGYYLNIHTEENSTGEIRGQLSFIEPPTPTP